MRIFCLASLLLCASCHAQLSDNVIRIGYITDLSGIYADTEGPGGVQAIRMAIADAQFLFHGPKIELLVANHQNKADVAAEKMRQWLSRDGVDMIIGGSNSAANLAMAHIARDFRKPFISVGAGTSRLTNEECSPYTIHYAYDTIALAKVTGKLVVAHGGLTWYFVTADYAFGAALQTDTSKVVTAAGGQVLGAVRHPIAATDFSSFVLQAKSSKAQVLALANAGGDAINAIKAANEFGVSKSMRVVGMLMSLSDIHTLTPAVAQGMYLTDSWYWDQNNETRQFSKRFFDVMKHMPTSLQAADYSAAFQYLKAVAGIGTDDAQKVLARMRSSPLNDMYTTNGSIRPDGRMVHDMYLMKVKSPQDVRYPWDYLTIERTIPGKQAFAIKAESKCSLWK